MKSYSTIEEQKYKVWRDGLLDVSKRNKMINYRKTKLTNLDITVPSLDVLYKRLSNNETLEFQKRINTDDQIMGFFYLMDKLGEPIELCDGEISSTVNTEDMNKILKQLRAKAKLSQEEQGINILYLSVGFLEWQQHPNEERIRSPLILIPVNLEITSLSKPYKLKKLDEDIVFNPTLEYLLSQGHYSIKLPEFDSTSDNILPFFEEMKEAVKYEGWKIIEETSLGLLSFLKIVMFKDLEKYKERIFENPVIQAFCGDCSQLKPVLPEWVDFDHDQTPASESFQVIPADASQQDAIMLAKNGVSFVLQGPPGTGKSQTIANIIAERLSAGKKVLFVSEKMAALNIVYQRLEDVKLADYCLPLHNYKADKKEVIRNLVETLDAPVVNVKVGADSFLADLEEKRTTLNQYFKELNLVRKPLNKSLYDAITELSLYETVPLHRLQEDTLFLTESEYNKKISQLKKTREYFKNFGVDIAKNPWYSSSLTDEGYYAESEAIETANAVKVYLKELVNAYRECNLDSGAEFWSWNKVVEFLSDLRRLDLTQFLQERIDNYYNNKIVCKLSEEDYRELVLCKNRFIEICEKSEFEDNSFSSQQKREQTASMLQRYKEEAELVIESISFFNADLGVEYQPTASDIREAARLAAVMLSCNKIESNWLISERYSAVEHIIKSAKSEFLAIQHAENQLYKVIKENIIYSLPDKKDISENAGYYLNTIKRLNSLYSQYNEASNELIKNGYLSCVPDNKQVIADATSKSIAKVKQIQDIIDFIYAFNEMFSVSVECNASGLKEIADFVSVLCHEGTPISIWIEIDNTSYLDRFFEKEEAMARNMRDVEAQIENGWTSNIYSIDYRNILNRFRLEYTSAIKKIGNQYKDDKNTISNCKKELKNKLSDNECISVLESLKRYDDIHTVFESDSKEAENVFGEYYQGLDTDWKALSLNILAGKKAASFRKAYGMTKEMKKACCIDKTLRKQIQIGIYTIESLENGEIINNMLSILKANGDTDFADKLQSLNEEFQALQALQYYVEQVEVFIQTQVYQCTIECPEFEIPKDIKLSSLTDYVTAYKNLCAVLRDYASQEEEYKAYFPMLYKGFFTDWEYISSIYYQSSAFFEYAEYYPISEKVKLLMTRDKAGRSNYMIGKYSLNDYATGRVLRIHEKLFAIYEDLRVVVEQEREFKAACYDYDYLISVFSERVAEMPGYATVSDYFAFLEKYFFINNFLEDKFEYYTKRICNVTAMEEGRVNNLVSAFCAFLNTKPLKEKTDNLLQAYSSATAEKAKADISALFIDADMFCKDAKVEKVDSFLCWFKDINLQNQSISAVEEKASLCSDSVSLHTWFAYSTIIRECESKGLTDYLAWLASNKIDIKWTVSAYRKAVLSKWYYDVMKENNLRYYQTFQAYSHIQTIEDFSKLDNQQYPLAQYRLNEILSHRKPSGLASMTNAMDEVAILRRESQRVNRVMPLRKLFKAIPNLLMKIKPCFMMSPLSVSYFLDSEMYSFDTVIFDEASQILPEDAIGAIYRGTQVIIAGDKNQMPPSTFFTSTIKDSDEFDEDEDDEKYYAGSILSESILDEANIWLPACNLNWHYRSKDESLIAFSNREIYGNRLITFPNCKKKKDTGLEYVFVQNGFYEGSPKNCNINEAKRCVELVEEHIRNNRDRSLGIIAFSEKQQSVIEDAIMEWRMKNPLYETFFDENKPEPFFVKNLENVQGDERDTIIFSICYARNKQGRLYMRFGPLGLTGGERRLNVAITRAKYNVKLVGSIYPNDLNISEDTPLGVKLLAKYISYAIQNDYEIPEGVNALRTEDMFTDVVTDFIRENGYQVRRNIGLSKYKVDIGVLKPGNSNEFLAGIECDGKNYSSARTARDRDLTRPRIMKEMGWNIFHVWIVDWNRNPDSCKRKLLYFLQNYANKESNPSPRSVKPLNFEDLVFTTETSGSEAKEDYQLYHNCDLNDPEFMVSSIRGRSKYESYLEYVLQNECPIHNDLLAKRLAVFEHRQSPSQLTYYNLSSAMNKPEKRNYYFSDNFWYKKDEPIYARKPINDQARRQFEHISPEEIQAGMLQIISSALSLTDKDLYNETARIFGWQRLSTGAKTILEENCNSLCATGKLLKSDGKIFYKG